MAFTKFTNLDFDQIKTSIKDYLRANSDFTGFDFDGSNFSVLIDTLAYNAYINSINSNLIVNESFIDSATVRRNVVSLAGNIGYLPRSKTSSRALVTFTVELSTNNPEPQTITLQPGLVAVGNVEDTGYIFSIPEPITANVNNFTAQFGTEENPIEIFQGSYVTSRFNVDDSIDQRFILNNSNIDYSTLIVSVATPNEVGRGLEWNRANNVLGVNEFSEVFFLNEIEDEKYELIFGDGVFGKQLRNQEVVNASYILTDGLSGNGPNNFAFSGTLVNNNGVVITPSNIIAISTIEGARRGANIESVSSVRYYAPRTYAAQSRAVTGNDYEALIKSIYPNAESISVVGGEELDPPQFGNVLISIKPVGGTEVSAFDKEFILRNIKQYSIAGINQQIIDLKLLFVELESFVYYDTNQNNSPQTLRDSVIKALEEYGNSVDLSKFGGRFKYSKAQSVIDGTNNAITSNITRVIVRRNLAAVFNQFTQYELCYGNAFYVTPDNGNIKSSGFNIFGVEDECFFYDLPNLDENGDLDGSGLGKIIIISNPVIENGKPQFDTVVENAGIIDYTKGEINITTIRFSGTTLSNNIIEIQAYPLSNDVIGLKDLYVSLAISDSKINMVRDTISSGEQVSGVGFKVTSSYGNGNLTR